MDKKPSKTKAPASVAAATKAKAAKATAEEKKKEKVGMKRGAPPETPEEPTAAAEAPAARSKPVKSKKTFEQLGVCPELCDAIKRLGWTNPTPIQAAAIPAALEGRDVIGLAQTGSGKTAAYSLPMLQALLAKPQALYAVVVTPTRELAVQVAEHIEALGATIGVKCATIVGGVPPIQQAIALAKRPHVVVGTPGRIVYHLEHTKGFALRQCRFLIIDEADRLLGFDFEQELDKILAAVPQQGRHTMLFSATMTTKVAKLQRASLRDPVKVQVKDKYKTVDTLCQTYLFVPFKYRDVHLVFVLNEHAGKSTIVFCSKRLAALRVCYMLRNLGFAAIPLTGNMTQTKRIGALDKFKSGQRSVLVATDVAARGLDIPQVDLVVNYDVPTPREYIHRVGRTARAGRGGEAVTVVTQYSVDQYQRVEASMNKKLEAYKVEEAQALVFMPRVAEALRLASVQMKEAGYDKQTKSDAKGAALLAEEGDMDGAGDFDGADGDGDDDVGELAAESYVLKAKRQRLNASKKGGKKGSKKGGRR